MVPRQNKSQILGLLIWNNKMGHSKYSVFQLKVHFNMCNLVHRSRTFVFSFGISDETASDSDVGKNDKIWHFRISNASRSYLSV